MTTNNKHTNSFLFGVMNLFIIGFFFYHENEKKKSEERLKKLKDKLDSSGFAADERQLRQDWQRIQNDVRVSFDKLVQQ